MSFGLFSSAAAVRAARCVGLGVLTAGAVMATMAPSAVAQFSERAATTERIVSVRPAFVIGHPATSTLRFVVALSSPSASSVAVHYQTVDGTAVGGTDYEAASGTATIPAGGRQTAVAVTVKPVAISPSGTTRAMSLGLSQPAGATLGTATAVGTIYPDPYTAPGSGSLGGAVIDPGSNFAYITNSTQNQVEVLNIRTGRYGAPIQVGSVPTALDITPDGKALYVCDSGGQTISVVDVATRRVVRTIITPAGFDSERPFSIAIGNAGYALFTTTFAGSGYGGHIYQLSLSSDAITVFTQAGINGLATEDTPLTRSADYSTIAGVIGDDSGGTFFVVRPEAGTVVKASLNGFIQWPALNSDGTTLLIDPASYGYGAGTYVVDTASGALRGTISGSGAGLAMGSSSTGYRMINGGVQRLNVPRFLPGPSLPAPDAQTPRGLNLSPNGHILLAPTNTGITIIRR